MTAAWIVLSTKWDFANVQATLNVIISVLGALGIWAFSRFWWQRGSSRIISKTNVPLSALFTFSSPGEAWDILTLLRGHLFERHYFPLLAQLVVILLVTAATTLAGPIARYALRSGHMIQQNTIAGLSAVKGGGYLGNSASANVFWNNTFQNLDQANFPKDQLLDFLPPSTLSWTYRADEWHPTWRVECNDTEETPLNITADPRYPIVDPLNAFPAFRDTLDPAWLNKSAYRVAADFCGWFLWGANTSVASLGKDVVSFVLIQSDPVVDDQMNKNQNPIHLSLSTIRLHSSSVIMPNGAVNSARTSWAMNGTVGNASYVRTECMITRKAVVADEGKIAWPWTNDTDSVIKAFADYNRFAVTEASVNSETVPLFNSSELFRFYQVYQVATSTGWQVQATKLLSVDFTTVELSTGFLAVVLLIVIFTIFGSIRYTLFYNRHKDTLETLFVPDGTIDWMIHAAKAAADAELGIKDRLHFQRATFSREPSNTPDRLARVQSGVALSDMKPPKAKSGRASIKKGAIVTVKEISDDSLAPSSSAGLDGRGSSVTVVTFARPQYDARHSGKARTNDASSPNGVDPLDRTDEKTEGGK